MVTGDPKHHVNVEGRQRATDAESVTTERADITADIKFGVFSDWHYNALYDSSNLDIPAESEAKSNFDEFATDMNDWGPDFVIMGGDNSHSDQSTSSGPAATQNEWMAQNQERHDYVVNNLDLPKDRIFWQMGDHEYTWTHEWGETYMYDAYPEFSSLEDTYRVKQVDGLDVVLLNTSFKDSSTSGSDQVKAPDAMLTWLDDYLASSDRPKIVHSHFALPRAVAIPNSDFDNQLETQKRIFNEPNIVYGIYGNDHAYDNDTWSALHETSEYGLQTNWLHVPDPQHLGGDTSVTPYAKGWVNVNGPRYTSGRVEASYAGDGTNYPEQFRFGARKEPGNVNLGMDQGVFWGGKNGGLTDRAGMECYEGDLRFVAERNSNLSQISWNILNSGTAPDMVLDWSSLIFQNSIQFSDNNILANPDGDGGSDSVNISYFGSGQQELSVKENGIDYDLPQGETLVPQSSKPSTPPSGEVKRVIADGTNWDPDSDGNAEVGILLPDGSFVETTDLGTAL